MKYIANPVEVQADVITGVGPKSDDGSFEIFFDINSTLVGGGAFTVTPEMSARYHPSVGDYLVIQSDGYAYLNPKDVFERKYGLLTEDQARTEKTLDISDIKGAKANISDLVVVGNGDSFRLLCKASSKSQGWMKSAKACEISGVGCVVQVTTQQGANVAEALVFVPGVRIVDDVNSGRRLVADNGEVHHTAIARNE